MAGGILAAGLQHESADLAAPSLPRAWRRAFDAASCASVESDCQLTGNAVRTMSQRIAGCRAVTSARPEIMLLVPDRAKTVTLRQDAPLGEGQTPRAR